MGFMNVTRKRKQRTVTVHGRRKVKVIATASTYMGNFCGYNVRVSSNYSSGKERFHISTLFIDEAINKGVEKYKAKFQQCPICGRQWHPSELSLDPDKISYHCPACGTQTGYYHGGRLS